MESNMKKLLPLRPLKPLDRLQPLRPLQPLGKTKWIKSHWRFDYGTRQWTWVDGHWAK
jgi:hypothetical protein